MPETRITPPPVLERARVAQARAELAQTVVSAPVARGLAAAFVIGLLLPHGAQVVVEPRFYVSLASTWAAPAEPGDEMSWFARLRAANRRTLERIQRVEDHLADASAIGTTVRPRVQQAMTAGLGAGNAQVEVGRDGWLFYRPDLDHVTGRGFLSPRHLALRAATGDSMAATPHPDPRPALRALRDELAARHITLVVAPTPVKPAADPGRVGRRAAANAPVTNRSYRQLLADLAAAGVIVFDPTGTLAAMRRQGARSLYLRTDTHWRPETMRRVATDLARAVEASVPTLGAAPRERRYDTTPTPVTNRGDIDRLLEPGPAFTLFPPETVSIDQVVTAAGDAWEPESPAEILLLGDSFTNIYSLASLGWGEGAGLAEQLSLALNRPVDRLSQNDDGAGAPRRLLAAALARDPARFARTQVVVYQFAARELSQGDWAAVDLEPAPRASTVAFRTPEPGEVATVTATVAAVGAVPRPGTVPYRDHIVALQVTGIDAGAADGLTAVVYARSMIDNELTEVAAYRPGDIVRLRLQPWMEVAPELDGITRGELDDIETLRAVPWWGVPVR